MPTPPAARTTVLDTNVVLDWLLFDHPDGRAIGEALNRGALRWIATAAMRDELAHVLARGRLDPWRPNPQAIWSGWDRHCEEVPASTGPAPRLRCTDPDDQKFIDLAIASGDCLLLSRDRAVLKLARRLRAAGVEACSPTSWAARLELTARHASRSVLSA